MWGKSLAPSPNQTKNFKHFFAPTFWSGWGVRNVIRQAQADENTGVNHYWTPEQYSLLSICHWDAGSDNQAGRGQSQAWFPSSPQPHFWVNRRDLVNSHPPAPFLADPLHPSIPLSSPTWRPLHQADPIMHCNKPWQKAGLPTPQQECNPKNLVHSKLMCSFQLIQGKSLSLL